MLIYIDFNREDKIEMNKIHNKGQYGVKDIFQFGRNAFIWRQRIEEVCRVEYVHIERLSP